MEQRRLCLDLTRLLSRVGQGPLTGVDRVERVYADWVFDTDSDSRYLIKTSRGYLLLDASGARRFLNKLDQGRDWPAPDIVSRLTRRGKNPRHGAERFLRSIAIDRCLPAGLAKMLGRHLPAASVYLNTGHSNVTAEVLSAVKSIPGGRSAVFLHDTIPLDFPEFSGVGTPERFRKLLDVIEAHADLILCNSEDTKRQINAHLERELPIVPALLGVQETTQTEKLNFDLDPHVPHFLTLGTIEPRKNHAILLDIWEQLPDARRPHLHIVGRRGWASSGLLDRLDTHPLRDIAIFEHSNLTDGQVSTLMRACRALLFPTFAEGFGLPPVEAAMLGVRPICADLPVLREILGNVGVYLDPTDAYSWLETIKQYSGDSVSADGLPWRDFPTWPQHFETVQRALWPVE